MTQDVDGDNEMIAHARTILGRDDAIVMAAIRDCPEPWKAAAILALVALREARGMPPMTEREIKPLLRRR